MNPSKILSYVERKVLSTANVGYQDFWFLKCKTVTHTGIHSVEHEGLGIWLRSMSSGERIDLLSSSKDSNKPRQAHPLIPSVLSY